MSQMAAETTYYCTCTTCRKEATVEGYETANDFFTHHAELGHQVEISQTKPE